MPTITVSASLPGASPGQLENEVARKIENGLATLQGLKHVYTKVQDGGVTITAEFRLEKPVQEALDDAVRLRFHGFVLNCQAICAIPSSTKLISPDHPGSHSRSRRSRMIDEALSWFVDNTLTRKLLSARGVGAITRVGGVDRQVQVQLDTARMQSLRVSAADVSRQLRQVQIEAAGGRTDLGAGTVGNASATVASAQELAQMEIGLSDGRRIRLDQIAKVVDTIAEQRSPRC